jgi:hypothetical protein
MDTVSYSEPILAEHPLLDDNTVYGEDDCDTDNEEEVKHDLVVCPECNTETHYLNEGCGKCGLEFKISKAGYILTGDDGDFICDDNEVVEYASTGYETPDIDKVGELSDDYETGDETGELSDDNENEYTFCIDDGDYIISGDVEHVKHTPRRITRSMMTTKKRQSPLDSDCRSPKQPKTN